MKTITILTTQLDILQYLSIVGLISIDALLGIWNGIKKEGFIVSKAMKVVKDLFIWVFILSLLLLIENTIPGTSWISESVLAPFAIFQLISIMKNLSKTTKNPLLNKLVTKIHNTSNPL